MLRKEGSKWVCDFAEKDGKHVAWDRKALTFVKRAEPPQAAAPAAAGGRNAAGKAPAAAPAAPPPERDSSDDEDEELDSEVEGEMQPPDDGEMQSADGWQRNDHVATSQRANKGIQDTAFPLAPPQPLHAAAQALAETASSSTPMALERATACRSASERTMESPLLLGHARDSILTRSYMYDLRDHTCMISARCE